MSIAGTLIMNDELKFYTRGQSVPCIFPPMMNHWDTIILKSGDTRSVITMALGITGQQMHKRCRCFV